MDRAVLYLRQSITREDSISLELQEAACRAYCGQRGYRVVAVDSDPGISGGTFNRPGVQRVMQRVKDREASVIVLWKWSRLSRKRLDWYVALDAVEQVGGRIESATEQIDTTTSVGRLSRGVLVELAAFERERISDQWKEVWDRRARLGLANGQPRFGYDLIDGQYVPNEWARVLPTVYQDWLDGKSMVSIATWLNELGAPTRQGGRWTSYTVRRTLRTGFAAGLIQAKGEYLPGVHPAVIDPNLWAAFYRRISDAPAPKRYGKHPLSGLLVCGGCGQVMWATNDRGVRGALWVCPGKKDKTCPDGGAMAYTTTANRVLDTWLDELLDGTDEEFEKALRAQPKPIGGKRDARRLVKIENDLLSIARKNKDGFYDDQTYLMLRAELLDEQRVLTKKLAEQQPLNRDVTLRAIEELRTLEGMDRNAALKLVVRHILVRRYEKPRYKVVPLWAA